MCAVLEELGLAGLVTTISGLTVTGAAAILAETGDPARFTTPQALDGHAGLCPRDNSSGAAQGKTSISGRGRPGLRLAAWRAVQAAMPDNPVMAARFACLTTIRQDNRLAPYAPPYLRHDHARRRRRPQGRPDRRPPRRPTRYHALRVHQVGPQDS